MIRVLRVIEYTYDDAEDAERDMGHWKLAANGTMMVSGRSIVIKSAIITDLDFQPSDD